MVSLIDARNYIVVLLLGTSKLIHTFQLNQPTTGLGTLTSLVKTTITRQKGGGTANRPMMLCIREARASTLIMEDHPDKTARMTGMERTAAGGLGTIVIAGVVLVQGLEIGILGAATDHTVPLRVGAGAGLTAGNVPAAAVDDEADPTVEIGIVIVPNLVLAMPSHLLLHLDPEMRYLLLQKCSSA
jgi:hypothetical protein